MAGRKKVIGKETIKEMCKMYGNGKTLQEISDRFGYSISYTRDLLVRNGVYNNKKRQATYEELEQTLIPLYTTVQKIKDQLPVGKIIRIPVCKYIDNKKVAIEHEYYIVKQLFTHVVRLRKMRYVNGKFEEMGQYGNFSPSYISLYLLMKNVGEEEVEV